MDPNGVCNLYSLTKGQAAIRELTKALVDRTGNLPQMPGIFPDYPVPIVRNGAEGRELVMARWGMPSSSRAIFENTKKRAAALEKKGGLVDFQALLKVEPDIGTTNIRNVASQQLEALAGSREPLRRPADQLLGIRHAARRQEGSGLALALALMFAAPSARAAMPETFDEMKAQIQTCYSEETTRFSKSCEKADYVADAVERACGILSMHWEIYAGGTGQDVRDSRILYFQNLRRQVILDAVTYKADECSERDRR